MMFRHQSWCFGGWICLLASFDFIPLFFVKPFMPSRDWTRGFTLSGKVSVPALSTSCFPSRFSSPPPAPSPKPFSSLTWTHRKFTYEVFLQRLRLLPGAVNLLTPINPDYLTITPIFPSLASGNTCWFSKAAFRCPGDKPGTNLNIKVHF